MRHRFDTRDSARPGAESRRSGAGGVRQHVDAAAAGLDLFDDRLVLVQRQHRLETRPIEVRQQLEDAGQ